jgi:hypothetical protein
LQHVAGGALVLAALTFLVATGFLGVGRGGEGLGEFGTFYRFAGLCWLEGKSMYDPEAYAEIAARFGIEAGDYGFGYAPTYAPLSMLFGLLTEDAGRRLLWSLNWTCIAVLASLAWLWLRHPIDSAHRRASPFLVYLGVALAIGNPFVSHCMWMGQLTLLAGTAVILGWYLTYRGHEFWAGLLFGLASFKAPVVILPVLWLALDRRWRVVLAMIVTALILSSYPLLLVGPVELMRSWYASIQGYQDVHVNVLGFRHVTGLSSFLVSANAPAPDPKAMLLISVAITVVMYRYTHRLVKDDVLGILFVLLLAFTYGHDYEFMYLMVVWIALILHLRNRPYMLIVLLILIVLLFVPQRFVRTWTEIQAVWHWRTPLVLGLGVWLAYLSFQCKAAADFESPANVDLQVSH